MTREKEKERRAETTERERERKQQIDLKAQEDGESEREREREEQKKRPEDMSFPQPPITVVWPDGGICLYIHYIYLYKDFCGSVGTDERSERLFSVVVALPTDARNRRFVQNCRSRGNLTFEGAQNRRSRANLTFKGAPNRRSRANLTFKSCPKPLVQSQLERQCSKTVKVTRQDKTSANATERRCS